MRQRENSLAPLLPLRHLRTSPDELPPPANSAGQRPPLLEMSPPVSTLDEPGLPMGSTHPLMCSCWNLNTIRTPVFHWAAALIYFLGFHPPSIPKRPPNDYALFSFGKCWARECGATSPQLRDSRSSCRSGTTVTATAHPLLNHTGRQHSPPTPLNNQWPRPDHPRPRATMLAVNPPPRMAERVSQWCRPNPSF